MTTIGALNSYIRDYTNCINECDFYNTDKTKRLGFDNTGCLLKCNSYFTQLRKQGEPSRPIYFKDASVIPFVRRNIDYKTCLYDLNCMEKVFQKEMCKKQCDLNRTFFSPYRSNRCLSLCEY